MQFEVLLLCIRAFGPPPMGPPDAYMRCFFRGFSPGVMQLGREIEVKITWTFIYAPPIRLHDFVLT
jgi:hypothetical protein